VPALQRFVVGALLAAALFAEPQTPLIGSAGVVFVQLLVVAEEAGAVAELQIATFPGLERLE
jgi:hypothetical protein